MHASGDLQDQRPPGLGPFVRLSTGTRRFAFMDRERASSRVYRGRRRGCTAAPDARCAPPEQEAEHREMQPHEQIAGVPTWVRGSGADAGDRRDCQRHDGNLLPVAAQHPRHEFAVARDSCSRRRREHTPTTTLAPTAALAARPMLALARRASFARTRAGGQSSSGRLLAPPARTSKHSRLKQQC